jgi:hypothetical protein
MKPKIKLVVITIAFIILILLGIKIITGFFYLYLIDKISEPYFTILTFVTIFIFVKLFFLTREGQYILDEIFHTINKK